MEIKITLNLDGEIILAIKNADKRLYTKEKLFDKVLTDEKVAEALDQVKQDWWYNTDKIKIVKL